MARDCQDGNGEKIELTERKQVVKKTARKKKINNVNNVTCNITIMYKICKEM